MPGYTHLQRAQPVRWSQWLMSHAAAFKQDLDRLRQVFERVNISPLGCGALAGNPFRIDRNIIAEELGFSGITLNSMNTSADRDFLIDFLVWNSIFTNHVSRWAEDLIIYSTSEFGFVRLADAYSTGSSLLPNKFNGDSLVNFICNTLRYCGTSLIYFRNFCAASQGVLSVKWLG